VTRVAFFSCAGSRHTSRCARRRRRGGAGDTDLAADDQNVRIGKQDGIIGRMWFSGIPVVLDHRADDDPAVGRFAAAARMDAALAVPFIHAGQSKDVIARYFYASGLSIL
jgi:hypothetical protein